MLATSAPGSWMALDSTVRGRRRIDTRVFEWLDARDTTLAAEWVGLLRDAPFPAVGLLTVSTVAIATATPLVWFTLALI